MVRQASAVVEEYFAAFARRDADAMAALWAPGGVDHIAGQVDAVGPDGVRAWFSALFAAFPDFDVRVRETVAQDGRVAVQWTATGTFAGPGRFQGIAPTGARVELEGIDLLRVGEDGLLIRNDAVADALSLVRQIGLVPPAGSGAERGMTGAFNARTRLARPLSGGRAEPVADGVWLVRGGVPREMNVYLIEDRLDGGVVAFDAGIRTMAGAIGAAAAELGGLRRIVLGHGHPDHRGAAPRLGVPVYCHPAERADAEGDGGTRYFHPDRLAAPVRAVYARLLPMWDGGPVPIAGTVDEGDEVAGFRVVHVPGHAPGMIALFRESDRLALTSDTFYTLDVSTTRRGAPRVPHAAFNLDTEQARASLRKLAALEPSAAWPGHAKPVTGDVRAQLQLAADGVVGERMRRAPEA